MIEVLFVAAECYRSEIYTMDREMCSDQVKGHMDITAKPQYSKLSDIKFYSTCVISEGNFAEIMKLKVLLLHSMLVIVKENFCLQVPQGIDVSAFPLLHQMYQSARKSTLCTNLIKK